MAPLIHISFQLFTSEFVLIPVFARFWFLFHIGVKFFLCSFRLFLKHLPFSTIIFPTTCFLISVLNSVLCSFKLLALEPSRGNLGTIVTGEILLILLDLLGKIIRFIWKFQFARFGGLIYFLFFMDLNVRNPQIDVCFDYLHSSNQCCVKNIQVL